MIYSIDNDLNTVHFDFLANKLISLLRHHNKDEDITHNKWQFLNLNEKIWSNGTKNFKDALESL